MVSFGWAMFGSSVVFWIIDRAFRAKRWFNRGYHKGFLDGKKSTPRVLYDSESGVDQSIEFDSK